MHQSTSKEPVASGPPPALCLEPSQASDQAQPKEMCGSIFCTGINSCSQTGTSVALDRSLRAAEDGDFTVSAGDSNV